MDPLDSRPTVYREQVYSDTVDICIDTDPLSFQYVIQYGYYNLVTVIIPKDTRNQYRIDFERAISFGHVKIYKMIMRYANDLSTNTINNIIRTMSNINTINLRIKLHLALVENDVKDAIKFNSLDYIKFIFRTNIIDRQRFSDIFFSALKEGRIKILQYLITYDTHLIIENVNYLYWYQVGYEVVSIKIFNFIVTKLQITTEVDQITIIMIWYKCVLYSNRIELVKYMLNKFPIIPERPDIFIPLSVSTSNPEILKYILYVIFPNDQDHNTFDNAVKQLFKLDKINVELLDILIKRYNPNHERLYNLFKMAIDEEEISIIKYMISLGMKFDIDLTNYVMDQYRFRVFQYMIETNQVRVKTYDDLMYFCYIAIIHEEVDIVKYFISMSVPQYISYESLQSMKFENTELKDLLLKTYGRK
jgi:hypothetical protein